MGDTMILPFDQQPELFWGPPHLRNPYSNPKAKKLKSIKILFDKILHPTNLIQPFPFFWGGGVHYESKTPRKRRRGAF